MCFKTERMVVREFTPADAADLHEILGDAETMRNCEPPYTPEATVQFLNEFCIGRKGGLAAVHNETGKVIGYLLFTVSDPGCYEMGWFFHRAWWGQGYAYEACSAPIRHAFARLGAHRVWAETTDPVKSVGLMKKLGMKPEGVQRRHTLDFQGNRADLYLYGLLREEYEF